MQRLSSFAVLQVAGVDLKTSGCGEEEYGLLDFFQDYWNANRTAVHRDLAQLFSGTGLQCTEYETYTSCAIRCAYEII
jgi:hypothetical protein